MWPFKKKNQFRELSEAEKKERTRIFILDDQQQNELIAYSERHGWHIRYSDRLNSFDDPCIVDSHIICIDINGVGSELGKKSGLDVAYSIKTQHPEKKVIIYSTQPISEFFHPVNEILDRRIYKQGDFEPFISAFKEFSAEIFSWNNVVSIFYERTKDYLPPNITYSIFRERMNQIPQKGLDLNASQVANVLGLSIVIAKEFLPLLLNGAKVE